MCFYIKGMKGRWMGETLINVGSKIVALDHDGNIIVLDPSTICEHLVYVWSI